MVTKIRNIISTFGVTADIKEINSRPAAKIFSTSYKVKLAVKLSDTEFLELYEALRVLNVKLSMVMPNE